MRDDDTDADDIRCRATNTSIGGPVGDRPRFSRRVPGHKSSIEGRVGTMAQHREDSDGNLSRDKDMPVDLDNVRCRLNAGQYTSIVCTV